MRTMPVAIGATVVGALGVATGIVDGAIVAGMLLALAPLVLAHRMRRPTVSLPFIDARFERHAFVVVAGGPGDAVVAPAPRAYVRVDDSTEVWTPARIAAARGADAPAPQRRHDDAAPTDYRVVRHRPAPAVAGDADRFAA